jgi:hypothetical protein
MTPRTNPGGSLSAVPRLPRADWDRPPWNRWSFQHIRELLPTAEVWRGPGPASHLSRSPVDLELLSFLTPDGLPLTVAEWLEGSFTDGFIVLHRGAIVFERYFNGMGERSLHLSQSVAKSVTGTVAGILVGAGRLDPDAPLTDYLPDLARTAYVGARVRHVLDMTSGVRYREDYEDLSSDVAATDVASGWKPPLPGRSYPSCMWDQVMGLTVAERAHGSLFQYRSIETDVLGFVLEAATGCRLSEVVSDLLWSKLGAEESACFTVDAAGFPSADGGFNATLRDYARFGLLHLDGGLANGRRILPAEWIADTRKGDPALFGAPYTETLPHGAYRNCFWVEDHRGRAYMARGVFGQTIYIDPDHQMVIVKLSSWPEFVSVARNRVALAAFHAIATHLTGTP